MFMYTYIYIYLYAFKYAYTHICIYVNIHTYVIYISTCIHLYTFTHMNAYTHLAQPTTLKIVQIPVRCLSVFAAELLLLPDQTVLHLRCCGSTSLRKAAPSTYSPARCPRQRCVRVCRLHNRHPRFPRLSPQYQRSVMTCIYSIRLRWASVGAEQGVSLWLTKATLY